MPIVISDDPSAVTAALIDVVNQLTVDMAAHTHGGIATGTGTSAVSSTTLTSEAITLRT
ncbi:hypothetical protein CCP3SC1AL1_320016 [Gammaproteobacteria bacterium]